MGKSNLSNLANTCFFLKIPSHKHVNKQLHYSSLHAVSRSFDQQYPLSKGEILAILSGPEEINEILFSLNCSFFSNGGKTFQVQLL